MSEFNIIVENSEFRESDLLLFFGEQSPPNLIRIPADSNMWDLLAEAGLFPSRSQARKDPKYGSMLKIPDGWSEFKFGRKKVDVFVLNCI